MLWEMVLQFWYVFWAVMTILIKGLKIRSNFVAHSELGPSTCGLCCWCHLPRHVRLPHHFPHHCHVSNHVIITIHVTVKSTATSSFMSPLCDVAIESVTKIILFVTLIFVIENGLGLGFGGPGTFHDGFKTSDQVIYDENLRNVTRCDLWCSIHDVIWDRHRYCFMTVFKWYVMKFNRHGSTDFL